MLHDGGGATSRVMLAGAACITSRTCNISWVGADKRGIHLASTDVCGLFVLPIR